MYARFYGILRSAVQNKACFCSGLTRKKIDMCGDSRRRAQDTVHKKTHFSPSSGYAKPARRVVKAPNTENMKTRMFIFQKIQSDLYLRQFYFDLNLKRQCQKRVAQAAKTNAQKMRELIFR